jgi:hypothetical protein
VKVRSWLQAYATPGLVDWLMAQRRGVSALHEPLLAITTPASGVVHRTGATAVSLGGRAAALGQNSTQVSWENLANGSSGTAGFFSVVGQ